MTIRPCPDCAVAVGELHSPGCDMETCPCCGRQRISCACERDHRHIPWAGESHGYLAAQALGWFAKYHEQRGWLRCDGSDPDAYPDINRLMALAHWDPKSQTWKDPSRE